MIRKHLRKNNPTIFICSNCHLNNNNNNNNNNICLGCLEFRFKKTDY